MWAPWNLTDHGTAEPIEKGSANNQSLLEYLQTRWITSRPLTFPRPSKYLYTLVNVLKHMGNIPISFHFYFFLWVLGGSINVLLGFLHRWSFTGEASRLGLVLSRRIAPRRFQDLGGPSPSGGQSRDHLPGTLQRILDHCSIVAGTADFCNESFPWLFWLNIKKHGWYTSTKHLKWC